MEPEYRNIPNVRDADFILFIYVSIYSTTFRIVPFFRCRATPLWAPDRGSRADSRSSPVSP